MIAPRAAAPREVVPAAIAGHLQLAGLLLMVVALREIEVSGGGPGRWPLIVAALLVDAATLAGAMFVRRRWKRQAHPVIHFPDAAGNLSVRGADAAGGEPRAPVSPTG